MLEQFSSAVTKIFSTLSSKAAGLDVVQRDLRNTLIDSDCPLSIADRLSEEVIAELERKRSKLKDAGELQVLGAFILKEKLKEMLSPKEQAQYFLPAAGGAVMFIGPSGSGKTTTVAKFAALIRSQSKKLENALLISSLDQTRPAAQEQLQTLSAKAGVGFFPGLAIDNNAQLCNLQDTTLATRKTHGSSILLIDTPGHWCANPEEFETAISKLQFCNPIKIVLVLDSMMGQRGLEFVRELGNKIKFDGAILTKLDSNSKAGIAISFGWTTKKPILFFCDGEALGDIDEFDADRFASRLVGFGDEKQIQKKIEAAMSGKDEKAAAEASRKRAMSGKMTLEDYAFQVKGIEKMGSLTKMLSYFPLFGSNINREALEKEQSSMLLDLSIINSMTQKERLNFELLDHSRKIRISSGSGQKPERVDELINRFTRMRDSVKMLARRHL